MTGLARARSTVAAGQAACIARGGVQTGPITVAAGGSLDLQGGMVDRADQGDGGGVVRVCGVFVTGPLTRDRQHRARRDRR